MSLGIIENLVVQLTKLPGIGRKSAQRLAFFILGMPRDDARAIAQAILDAKEKAGFCSICSNVTDRDPCHICADPTRDRSRICVVEEPSNIAAFERSRSYRGTYHVLLGALSPIDGITPERLRLKELAQRVADEDIEEIIIATNPNTRGEITARYISEMLRPFGKKMTRLAYGLPIGSDIEFADEVTLAKSLEGRREL